MSHRITTHQQKCLRSSSKIFYHPKRFHLKLLTFRSTKQLKSMQVLSQRIVLLVH
ncbi:hypothetical protein PBCV1_a044aL [Paramecium bursaria Chlorella virus 1]|uniref:Uncharacterized protein n=1 Tax=Paramecium bursaria Chlorella virus 1 TaxID=10506 RepID=F8TTW0_PBCV1|nr:hypothetical protein PBCV1_a044aL [Paramecium bursaria Chlorella virus 1]AEI70021.1 hypothetical protein [Paramecium bursaria Chlorella virus 1]